MAKVFGLPGLDEDSARAFADKLTKYAGFVRSNIAGRVCSWSTIISKVGRPRIFCFRLCPTTTCWFRSSPFAAEATAPCWSLRR